MTPAPAPAEFSLAVCLSRHPYFRNLGPQSLNLLVQAATMHQFAAEEIIFLEGDPSAGLWVVERGRVKIYKISLEGREHILHMPGPGDSFNDISALDGGPNPANAAALTAVTAWAIGSQDLRAMLHTDPALALAALEVLTARVRTLVRQIEDLALYSVPARLARFLLAQMDNAPSGRPPVTRAAIAAHLATTPESVSRALRMLEEAGAIRFDRHRIVIVDPDLLRTLALG